MEEWDNQPFTECTEPVRVDRAKQIKVRQYQSEGKYPIVDQGQGSVGGWTDNEVAVIKDGLPYIVFGDHTRLLKYVDFPFALGADGTKLLKPKDEINALYFFFHLLCLDIPSRGYSRHYRLLKEKVISLPPLPEQKKIAAVLLKLQRAIETQEKVIQSLRDLKKSTMQHLFTHGLRGEKTKMTEIGEIPESWEATDLGQMIDIKHGYSFRSRFFSSEGPIVLTLGNFRLDGGLYWGPKTKRTTEPYAKELVLQIGDLVIVMTDLTPSAKLLGSPAFIPRDMVILHNQRIGKVIVTDKRTSPVFLYWVFLSPGFKRYMANTATGSAVRHTSPGRIKAYRFGLPKATEQAEVARILASLDEKLDNHESKKSALQDLFKTTLNRLMSGEIRVQHLDIDVSEIEVCRSLSGSQSSQTRRILAGCRVMWRGCVSS